MTSTVHSLPPFCVRHRMSRVAVPIVLILLEVVALGSSASGLFVAADGRLEGEIPLFSTWLISWALIAFLTVETPYWSRRSRIRAIAIPALPVAGVLVGWSVIVLVGFVWPEAGLVLFFVALVASPLVTLIAALALVVPLVDLAEQGLRSAW
jgi:hypothetical protein